jgi:hypothetical protein
MLTPIQGLNAGLVVVAGFFVFFSAAEIDAFIFEGW